MTEHKVFTYGTLMLPEVMSAVTGKYFPSTQACLKNYQRFQIKKKIYPAIIYAEEASTDGVLYYDIDETSLQRLDFFEDVIYYRKEVVVAINDSESIPAYAYIMNPDYESSLSTEAWDLQTFKDECLERYVRRTSQWMEEYEPS